MARSGKVAPTARFAYGLILMSTTAVAAPRTLAETLPAVRLRTPALIVAGALLTALAAQIRIPLGFTPVPITGQTFAVLLAGAALGSWRAMASQALYWLTGIVGLPFYTGGKSGWKVATGSTFGYFIGFVLAAGLIGFLAERGQDRNLISSISAMAAGSVVIYVCGVAWLAHSIHVPVYAGNGKDAVSYGLAPFLVGDLLKLALAALSTPAAWALVRRSRES